MTKYIQRKEPRGTLRFRVPRDLKLISDYSHSKVWNKHRLPQFQKPLEIAGFFINFFLYFLYSLYFLCFTNGVLSKVLSLLSTFIRSQIRYRSKLDIALCQFTISLFDKGNRHLTRKTNLKGFSTDFIKLSAYTLKSVTIKV